MWEPATQRIVATARGKTIELVVGRRDAAIDGRPVTLDVPPTVVQGRTMVPLRFVSEALGAFVQWQNETRTVQITLPAAEATPVPAPMPSPVPVATATAPPTPVPTSAPTAAPTPTSTPSVRVTEGVLVATNFTTTPPRIQVSMGAVIYVFLVTPQTAILRFDAGTGGGGSVALTALRPGDQARVETGGTGNEATTVRAFYRLARGRVDVMTATAIALLDGQVIRINSDAAVTVNGAAVALADAPARVRRGDDVLIRLNPTTNEAWELTVGGAVSVTPTPTVTATVRVPGPGSAVMTAVADSPVIESAPGIPHPSEVLLVGRDAAGRYRSVVRFNVALPQGTTMRRATLRLFMYSIRTGGADLYSVFPITQPWTEATATWASLAAGHSTGRSAGPVLIGAGTTRTFIEWDVTEIVRGWLEGSLPSYGFLIRNLELGANLLYFGNREDVPANRPQLTIEYSSP